MLPRRLSASSLCGCTKSTNLRPITFIAIKAYSNNTIIWHQIGFDIFTRSGDIDENAVLHHFRKMESLKKTFLVSFSLSKLCLDILWWLTMIGTILIQTCQPGGLWKLQELFGIQNMNQIRQRPAFFLKFLLFASYVINFLQRLIHKLVQFSFMTSRCAF